MTKQHNIPVFNTLGRRSFLLQSASLLGLTALLLVGCTSTSNRSTKRQAQTKVSAMKLESDAFSSNGTIPPKYTCDGENISPPLKWDQPPIGTKTFALIVDDPDAPGHTFVHWVLYDLPADTRQLSEGIISQSILSNGGAQGKNDFSRLGYGGACPPNGTHRYFFKLYALDRILGLAAGVTKDKVVAAMDGHILETAELMGRYARQPEFVHE